MKTYLRPVLWLLGSAALLLTADGAVAQAVNGGVAKPEDGLTEIVVTGVRASVKSALDEKKNSDQVRDSIVAEDIGKLPDNNVIEALQHVTGVQISRNAAEANQLLIRGLPDINTLLNGREIFTSTGRFVSLQDIPAELLQRVDVEKSARADDIEGGIAGVVDVRLHRPFDFSGTELAGTLRETHSSLSSHNDPAASLLASSRWDTGAGEFGLLGDVSYSRANYKEEILDNYISSQKIGPVAGSTGPLGAAYIPLTQGAQSILGDRERTSANLSAQWKPNDSLDFYAEGFYTRYRNPNSNDFFVGLPWIGANAATATVFPGTDEVKTVTGGGYELTSDQSYVPKTDTYQMAMGGTWTNGNVTLSSEVDYTNSKFSQTGYILDTEYYPPTYNADFNYHGTGTTFISVPGFNLNDPANFHIRQVYDQWTEQSGDEIDWRGDLTFKLDNVTGLKSIATGLRFVDRFARNRADNPSGLDCRGASTPSSANNAAVLAAIASKACFTALNALPGTAYHATGGSIFNGAFGLTNWTDASPAWLNNNIAYLRELFGQSPTGARPGADPTQSFDDREKSYAAYIKGNFEFELGSHSLVGNVGLRLIDTAASMAGTTLTTLLVTAPSNYSFTYSPATSDKNTLDWLPSLNARLTLADDFFLRFAASKTVTRPTFVQLDPALTLSGSTGTLLGSGNQGNANLSPDRSTNGDLSLEYYFGGQNAVTGAVFYRQIDGYIQAGNPVSELIGGINYQVGGPVNAPPGHIDGLEMGYTQFFDFLPGVLNGLGMQANGTYVNGPFQNISKWSYNLVGIYEKGPVSFRVAYNWREGFFVGPAPGGGQQPNQIFSKSQPWLDLSASYKVMERLTVTFDATNLLNSYYQDYFGSQADYPRDTRRFDQTYSLGVRFKL
jgi:iron complex outermembrane recepter protein